MTMNEFESLFLWMTLINSGLLIFSTVALLVLRDSIFRLHGSMFKVSESQVAEVTYSYLANFNVLVIVFNLAPLLTLLVIN